MNRYTTKGFRYEADTPMARLQELEDKIEDGVLKEVKREQTVNEYSVTYFYGKRNGDIGYGRTIIACKVGAVYTEENMRDTEKSICREYKYKNAVIINIIPLEGE